MLQKKKMCVKSEISYSMNRQHVEITICILFWMRLAASLAFLAEVVGELLKPFHVVLVDGRFRS